MRLFSSFFSILNLAAKRLWNHRLLMLCLLAGLVAAVGLLSSIPMYAEAVHHRLLQGELTEAGVHRPPFAFLWRYVGTWHGDIAWEEYAPVDEYLTQQASGGIGLPLELSVRHARTGSLRLFAASGSQSFEEREPLMWTSLGFVTALAEGAPGSLEAHLDLVEGTFPQAGEDVQVLVSQVLAEEVGLQVGERYVLFGTEGEGQAAQVQIPVRVAAIWRPRDPAEAFWFYQPESLDKVLLTAEPVFAGQVVPLLEAPVSLAVWYQVFDGRRVRTADVPGLLGQVATTESRAAALLTHTGLDVSPVEALAAYRQAARFLTVMLTVLSIPVVGLILYFVALIAGLAVRRSQAEIAILRSRGTTRLQVVIVYLMEGLLVGGAGLVGGLAMGRWLAHLMGQMRTFLDPALLAAAGAPGEALAIVVTPTALWYGLLGVGLALLALLIPALVASRHTIVTFKWERARALLRPVWQRTFVDLLLLVPPLYGWYLLRQQGTIAVLGRGDDPFSNPLLFLVPVLFCFSLALLFLRVFPWLMGALAWLANWLPGTTHLLTLRQLARSTGQYTGPLLLLTLTLSLAIFTASTAVTLDSHLRDRVYYQTGADLKLAEMGESTEDPEQRGLPGQSSVPTAPDEGPRWLFLPVGEHLQVQGVEAAARVGNFGATAKIGGRQQTGRLVGVDRLDFPAVAFYRSDFAEGESVGGLMNRLAVSPSNLLVSRDFMARNGLVAGDPLQMTVSAAGESHEIAFTIAGPVDLFPTLYPQDGPFFVGNLEHIYEGLGGTFPYDVWLATDPSVAGEEIVTGVRDLGLAVIAAVDAEETIAAEQTRPERQGLFGLLSVGFLASAILTVLGFLVYAISSFQRRFIELGMLRAVGLSVGQMAGYLAGEQALLIVTGGGLGTVLGVLASTLFIPYLQVGTGKAAQVPPFVVQIAWGELWTIYAVFGAMFVVAVGVLILLLVRMKVFEAVKLGEVG